jgi:hypothetical protein
MGPGWGKPKVIGSYMGLSERKTRDLFKEGLRHVRLPTGTLLSKFEWADEYLEQFEVKPRNAVDQIVDDVMHDLISDKGIE